MNRSETREGAAWGLLSAPSLRPRTGHTVPDHIQVAHADITKAYRPSSVLLARPSPTRRSSCIPVSHSLDVECRLRREYDQEIGRLRAQCDQKLAAARAEAGGLKNQIDTEREIFGKELALLREQLQQRDDLLDSIRGLLADDEAAA